MASGTTRRIERYFQSDARALGQPPFQVFDNLPPVVTVEQNFDDLLIPPEHVSRQASDTYYVDDRRVLRCHTSAHQTALLRQGETRFLVSGDVYRRDEVDSTHYPVFHQMEGVRVLTKAEVSAVRPIDQSKGWPSGMQNASSMLTLNIPKTSCG